MAKKVVVERETEADPVVHEHHDGGNGLGVIVGIIVLIVVLFLAVYYGLPYIRNSAAPQINVPSQIDVNVNRQ